MHVPVCVVMARGALRKATMARDAHKRSHPQSNFPVDRLEAAAGK